LIYNCISHKSQFQKYSSTTHLDEGSHVVKLLHEDGHLLVQARLVEGGVIEASTKHHIWRSGSHERRILLGLLL